MKIIIRHFPGLFLIALIFVPNIKKINPVRLDDILIIIALIIVFLRQENIKNKIREKLDIDKSFTKMAIACVIGIFVGGIVLGLNVVGRDYLIFIQMLKYYIIYWIVGNIIYDKHIIKVFHHYVLFGLFLSSIIAVAQYWNIAGINEWLTPLYFDKELALQQMVEAEMNFRVSGTMSNPNYYGYMLVWMMAWVISLNYFNKKYISKYILIIVLIISFLALLLIQSRTALFGIVIAGFIMSYLSKSIKNVFKIVSILLIVSSALYLISDSEGMTDRGFGERLNLSSDSSSRSFSARNRDLVLPFIIMTEVPVIIPFGLGPSKTVIRRDSHNGFTWIAIRMGIYGMFVYMAMIYRNVKKANNLLKNKNVYSEYRSIGLASLLCVIPWINGELTGNILKDVQLTSINMISLGWLQYALYNYKDHKITASDTIE